jgi:two-component system, OmpR family, KDP operon response regulator KdpE
VNTPAGTVLVVDDERSIRLLCRVNLELEGWDVCEADSIAQARQRLAGGEVRAVLLDVHLRDGSGIAFLEEIRRDYPETRIALLTGTVDAPTLDGVGPDALIPKPFTLVQLVGTMRNLAG